MRKQLYDLEVIQYCAVMKKVKCGGQPLTDDPGVDINLVLYLSTRVHVWYSPTMDWEVVLKTDHHSSKTQQPPKHDMASHSLKGISTITYNYCQFKLRPCLVVTPFQVRPCQAGHKCLYSYVLQLELFHYTLQEPNVCNAREGGLGKIFIQQKSLAVQYVNKGMTVKEVCPKCNEAHCCTL